MILFYILFLINLYLYLYIYICVYIYIYGCMHMFLMFMWYITSCNWCNLCIIKIYIHIYMDASAGNIDWRLYNMSLICVYVYTHIHITDAGMGQNLWHYPIWGIDHPFATYSGVPFGAKVLIHSHVWHVMSTLDIVCIYNIILYDYDFIYIHIISLM